MENRQTFLYDRVKKAFLKEKKDMSMIQKAWFQVQPKLMVCGGGHVAVQVVKLAKMLDFYVKVMDDRAEFANAAHFPDADEICCCDYETVSERFPTEENTYFVVVTRGHVGDLTCVRQILNRKYAYLGMIGSKAKVAHTTAVLLEEGYDSDAVKSIHAPIGIAIQAQTPAEIAVSIMAEIIACKNSGAVSTLTTELNERTEAGTLCLITQKTGSSPRNAGSMMLVARDGGVTGSIGGGSVEHAAIAYAKTVTEISEQEYDLSNGESAELGMVCGGSNRVLFIPLE